MPSLVRIVQSWVDSDILKWGIKITLTGKLTQKILENDSVIVGFRLTTIA